MERADVIILGGGLIGLATALALDAHGVSSIVIDPADPRATLDAGFDGRASAIASASWRMLDAIGIGAALRPHGCPIRKIEARDGLSRESLDFVVDLDDPLGTMVANTELRRALRGAAVSAAHIALIMPERAATVERTRASVTVTTASGETLAADLLIAAEGRNSPTRAAAGIRVARWDYPHAAIISAFDHSIPHDNVAHEIFYPEGPFALLPMLPGNRSALVWSVKAKDAPGMLALSDHAFTTEAAKKMGGILGDIASAAPRSSYPLGFHHAAHITGERLALVGDAGHGIHPIAGQGLNLGLRDVAALVEVLVDGARTGLDLGDPALLDRYQRWRGLDTLMVAAATDGLTRIYGVPGRTARAVRRFGMGVIDKVAPVKSLLMAEARGETGKQPKLLQGITI